MRIFIGTTEIAGQIPLFAAGFRALGHTVTTGVPIGHSYTFGSIHYDVQLRQGDMRQVQNLISEHDIFIFQFGRSLLPNNLDYRIIHNAGKKIICIFNGDDIRYWPAHEQQYNMDYKKITNEEPPEYWNTQSILRVLPTLRRGEIYADLIITHPNDAQLMLRPYQHFFLPLQTKNFHFSFPDRNIPVIVHAPSDKAIKGTKNILSALQSLEAEGVKFELHLLDGVPNAQVLRELSNADCVVDQTMFSAGMFALEAMCCGCAVATGFYPAMEPLASLLPIHAVSPYTLKKDLYALLTNQHLRKKLAYEGHKYVQKYHDAESVCQRILQDLEDGETRIYDYHPHFYAKKFSLPEGVYIPKQLQEMGDKIITQWGLPEHADPTELVCKGLFSSAILKLPISKWESSSNDCARYLKSSSISKVPCAAFYPPVSIPKIFQEMHKFSLQQLCPLENFSLQAMTAIHNELRQGCHQNVLMLLEKQLHNENSNHINGNIAIALILWGLGEYKNISFFCHYSDKTLSGLLLHWLSGIYLLSKGDTIQAIPLLQKALDSLPKKKKNIAALGNISNVAESINLLICWKKPKNYSGLWYSPASIIPDWCAIEKNSFLWPLLLFMLLSNGYSIYQNKYDTLYSGILNKILSDNNCIFKQNNSII